MCVPCHSLSTRDTAKSHEDVCQRSEGGIAQLDGAYNGLKGPQNTGPIAAKGWFGSMEKKRKKEGGEEGRKEEERKGSRSNW